MLLLSIDSLRWDLLDALPRLREAIGPHAVFTRAVSPSSRTLHSLPCSLRGRPFRQVEFEPGVGIRSQALLRDRSPTLASVLARAGYRALAVPTHRYVAPSTGLLMGFEPILHRRFASIEDGHRLPTGGLAMIRATEALSLLERSIKGDRRPVIGWIHFLEGHEPYHSGASRVGPPTLRGLKRAVRELDRHLALAVRRIERLRGRKPIVVVFGDHGEEFGEHGAKHHGSSVYAEQVRVALVIAAPGAPPGRYDGPVSTSSVPATLLELLGLSVPEAMTEPSLLPALSGEAPWPTLAVSELRFGGRNLVGYTGARWRLLYDPVLRIEELYDSERDPYEGRDLARLDGSALGQMRRLAREWDETH